MPYTVDDIIDFIMTNDNVGLKDAVHDVLSAKTDDAVETHKQNMVASIFNTSDEDETEEESEENEEEVEDEETDEEEEVDDNDNEE